MKKQFILLLINTFFSVSYGQKTTLTIFDKTDTFIEETIDSLQIVGLNYAVLQDGKLLHAKAFGTASLQLDVTMTLQHSFPVASISKLFSSVALHKLLLQHQRSVNETVADFLPSRKDLPESWRLLTLKQLLSHTSGIPDQIDYGIFLAPKSDAYVIEAMKNKPFSASPGTESKYNATGFLLVRMIFEKLAGQDFEAYMHKHYFEALNMPSAVYGGFKKVVSNRVSCYQNNQGDFELFPLNYAALMFAGAGLNINIQDLIKWFQAVYNNSILDEKQLDTVWTPVRLQNGQYGTFGLGWEAAVLQGGFRMVGHGGAGISSLRHYWNTKTKQNFTVIVLTNGAMHWKLSPHQINTQIANMLLAE
jgi:CubicO group peptidase (beta-lactamase class C family)